jgi:hypothetical protein
MGTAVLESIRQDLRESMRAAHANEMVPFGHTTAAELFDRAEAFADDLTKHASDLAPLINERGFEKLFATLDRVRRSLEAISANALNTVAERGVHHADGHRTAQAFLQASVNISNRERVERRLIAELVAFCPQVGDLLSDGTLPVGHAVTLGRLVANDRICRDDLTAAMSGFLLTANLTPHDVFNRHVRAWGRLHDFDGSPPDAEASHRHRNLRLSNVLDGFVLDGRFGPIQGAKLQAILQAFVDIESDRDWQQARQIYGDDTCIQHLARTPGQRRADALEAIFLAAIGQGTAKDVDIIINIVTDADTFTTAAAHAANAAASDEAVNDSPDATVDDGATADAVTADEASDHEPPDEAAHESTAASDAVVESDRVADTCERSDHVDAAADAEPSQHGAPRHPAHPPHRAPRRFCHTLEGVEINPLAALQAALDGHVRMLIAGEDGVIINQGRKQRFFRGNARLAAQLQAGLDRLTRCSYPGCRASPRHIDHATEWVDLGCTDVANANIPCARHNLWKSKHGYTVRRDESGNLHTYRPDGTELRPY